MGGNGRVNTISGAHSLPQVAPQELGETIPLEKDCGGLPSSASLSHHSLHDLLSCLSGGFSGDRSSGLGLKSPFSGSQGDVTVCTDAPPEGSTSPQEPARPLMRPPAGSWGEASRPPGGSSSLRLGPGSWRSLCDYRLCACSGPSPQGVPMRVSRHFLATTWLMRTGGRGGGREAEGPCCPPNLIPGQEMSLPGLPGY